MIIERGIQVDHSTIMRWVHQYSPEIEKKIRRHLRPTNNSWRKTKGSDKASKKSWTQYLRKHVNPIVKKNQILCFIYRQSFVYSIFLSQSSECGYVFELRFVP
jgi:hypothetical protein